ncbi:MAG: lamin tail domain-containing protein, partial [Bacteroidales bacterium]|nr:lamin tail domain-containing protein [Bacteroidales bacterium]
MKGIVFIICCFIAINYANAQDLFINEFMSSNENTILDEDGDSGDWIELYNASDNTVNLAGYGLSDKEENPFKWIFPEV